MVSSDWKHLLGLIPGYDPRRGAEGCWFDPDAASRAIGFIHDCIRHAEGQLRGQPFLMQPWQQSFIANLFGWQRRDEWDRQVRRYREAFLYVPRKNGKTPLAAALALYVFFCDNEPGAQCYIAAGEREQAGLLFRQAKGMVEQEPELKRRCRIYGGNAAAGQSRSIVREQDGSFLRVISADAQTKHGGNTHLAIVDELHTQPDRELVDVLQTSMASANRRQPLLILITTADFDRPSICNEKHDYASKVRDGIVDDPSYLPVIFETPRDADWKSEGVWAKANPNLGVSVSLDYLRRESKRAAEIPAYENTFRRLHLNQRTEQAERAIPMDRWDACRGVISLPELAGRTCFGGLDLGATSDFTALVLLFPWDGAYKLLPFFWLPSRPVRRDPRMEAVIEGWRKQGFIKTTEGNVVDYDRVEEDIDSLAQQYSIREIAVDRAFQGAALCNALMRRGHQVVDFGQGYASMAAPTKAFLELVLEGKLHHGGHPVLRWMASNVAAETEGSPANLKFSKKRSAEKVDGVIAAVMSLGLALADPHVGNSVYEERGLEFLEVE